MKVAIEVFISVFILSLTVALASCFIASDLTVMEARDTYQTYVNELQESNFADDVISACMADAVANGYSLTIDVSTDSDGNRTAYIVLSYEYGVQILGLSQTKTIKGFIS